MVDHEQPVTAFATATSVAAETAYALVADLKARGLDTGLRVMDNDEGVMLEWFDHGLYCDIDPDGELTLSRAGAPNAAGFVTLDSETFYSAAGVAKRVQRLLAPL